MRDPTVLFRVPLKLGQREDLAFKRHLQRNDILNSSKRTIPRTKCNQIIVDTKDMMSSSEFLKREIYDTIFMWLDGI